MAVWYYLQSLINNASNGQPTGGQPPAALQAGNSQSGIMGKISGMLGGGDPMQQQNNTYMKGKVDEYMAQKQAVQARAQQKGAMAAQRELKKGTAQLQPPVPPGPAPGQTPSTSVQQILQNMGAGKTQK